MNITIQKHDAIKAAVENYRNYIASQTLAEEITLVDTIDGDEVREVELGDGVKTKIKVEKEEA